MISWHITWWLFKKSYFIKLFYAPTTYILVGNKEIIITCLLKYTQKTIEGYSNSFDSITFEKIISIQGVFVYDKTRNMQFRRMQNKVYGSLVTIQYHTKCANPLYQKFTSKKISCYIFAATATFTWSLLMFKFWTQKSVNTHLLIIAPNNMTTSSTKMHSYGSSSQYDNKLEVKH